MTEIDKLFENAGIKKQYCGWLDMGDLDCQPQYVKCNSIAEWKDTVFSSRFGESEEEPEHKYPPFTAKKQIELIKWLCQKTYRNYLLVRYDFMNCQWQIECNMTDSNKLDSFNETIASIINNLWQSLTDQEKEEIRKILNENS